MQVCEDILVCDVSLTGLGSYKLSGGGDIMGQYILVCDVPLTGLCRYKLRGEIWIKHVPPGQN